MILWFNVIVKLSEGLIFISVGVAIMCMNVPIMFLYLVPIVYVYLVKFVKVFWKDFDSVWRVFISLGLCVVFLRKYYGKE